MSYKDEKLSAGLYFVATPLGRARDITLRGLDILASADVLVAEDTRTLRKLLELHGISLGTRKLWAYHDHSGDETRRKITEMISAGNSVAYASEAGTPLIADPGFALARDVIDQSLPLQAAPGPCAAIAALTLAGLPTDRFLFCGFSPASTAARKAYLSQWRDVSATLVFYESPKRLGAMLKDAAEMLGAHRHAAICREITKKFEEVRRDHLENLSQFYAQTAVKGEVVVIIERADSPSVNLEDLQQDLKELMMEHKVKDAARIMAQAHGLSNRDVYQLALKIKV